MSLGVLSFLVGTQIGAQQKSKYLSAIEEQKRQETKAEVGYSFISYISRKLPIFMSVYSIT